MTKPASNSFEVFPWNKNFETRIPLVDKQHRMLVGLLNRLSTHLADQSAPVELNRVFKELADYASYHFQTEESIWQKYFCNDPWYARHQQIHESFVKKVEALKEEEKYKSLYEVTADIVKFLTHWLAFHILDSDRRYAIAALAIDNGMTVENAKNHAEVTMNDSIEVLIDTVLMMYSTLSSRTLELMQEKNARRRAEEALQISEERWKFVMASAGDEIWDWDIGKGVIERTDKPPAILSLFIQSPNIQHERIHPDDIDQVKSDLQAHLDGNTETFANEHRVINRDGVCSWVITRGKVISRNRSGKALRMIGTHINITEREIAALLYRNSSEGMMVTDADDRIVSVNPAFTEITGFALREVVGQTPMIMRSDRHTREFYRKIRQGLADSGHWQGEIWYRRKNGTVYPLWLSINSVYNPDRSLHYRIALFTDITERKVREEIIWKQANIDPLTELPNRRLFFDRFGYALNAASRSRQKLALLFIDLDRFKEINDSLGHSVGDQLLVEVSKRLKGCVRETDTVSRLSGDEFTVILNNIETLEITERIADKILGKLREPFPIGAEYVFISASIGITYYPEDGTSKEDLLRHADQAMYQAKKDGRNRTTFFSPAMQDGNRHRIRLGSDLSQALADNQFELFYQPIVDLKTGSAAKAEALLRWRHPEFGLIGPDEFIAVAENTGAIHRIGDWMFYQSVRQIKAWQPALTGDFQIGLDKSPIQFLTNEESPRDWIDYLKKLDVSGRRFIVEIPECLLLDADGAFSLQLDRLARVGISIALDDFGSGFSSAVYLQKYAVHFIKIDKSIVDTLSPSSGRLSVCKAITAMAHAMDIKVIAQGVATEEQCRLLADLGCDYGQGDWFSAPVTAEEFNHRFLSNTSRPQ
ncbi:MAG: bacteriohemerythrin [Gammaproteobacteria bacterium]